MTPASSARRSGPRTPSRSSDRRNRKRPIQYDERLRGPMANPGDALPRQRLPPPRHPLRQARPKLPLNRSPRRRHRLLARNESGPQCSADWSSKGGSPPSSRRQRVWRGMPSRSSMRLAGWCDCSTMLMFSSFSAAGYLARRCPQRCTGRIGFARTSLPAIFIAPIVDWDSFASMLDGTWLE